MEKNQTHGQGANSLSWWTRLLTRRIQFLLDIVLFAAAFIFAYQLRFDFNLPRDWALTMAWQLPFVVALQLIGLSVAGGYSFIWRYTSLTHLRIFLIAAPGTLALLVGLRFVTPDNLAGWRIPLSVCLMDTLLAFGGALALRVGRRIFFESYERLKRQRATLADGRIIKSVLLIGAGEAGFMVAREIEKQGNSELDILGFVDDDADKFGKKVYGDLKVLGHTGDLPALAEALRIDHVVITIARATREEIRRIVGICETHRLKVRIMPELYEIIQGNVSVSRIRDVQIEDLLGREPVVLDEDGLQHLLSGKTVAVTGAGGSIGAELARQIARFNPARLLLIERAENALFVIQQELQELGFACPIVPLLADIGDDARALAIFETYQPQVILHAAAHKHVPLMEANAGEAVKNNVLATQRLGAIAGENGAEIFILISTDKAVCPTSIMGATKRLAELIAQDLNGRYATKFAAVRFGNVIGSAGSVVPIFQAQIRNRGAVTITDKRMTRYFMTIPEAAQLVLQAGALAEHGGEVYILDMGQPVSILELAENLITLSGLRPHRDIHIIETGIRPGEKLIEELMNKDELTETGHPKIFINKIVPRETVNWTMMLTRLSALADAGREKELRELLSRLVPEANLSLATERPEPVVFVRALAVNGGKDDYASP